MPNKQSAKKELRKIAKRNVWNKARKEAYKTAMKNAAKTEKYQDAIKAVQLAQKALGKAAKRGVIKKRTAARKLSRLMKKVNALAKK